MKLLLMIILSTIIGLTVTNGISSDPDRCNKELTESYNISSLLVPRNMDFYLCPAMKQSCCSLYDQFSMYNNWREVIKPKLEAYYKDIEQKLVRIRDMTKAVFNINFRELVDKLHEEQKQKDKVLKQFLMLQDKKLPQLIDQVLDLYNPNKEFMMRLRSTFFCNICDYSSHRYIDVYEKMVYINETTCKEIATNTINFSYFLNTELSKYLSDLTGVLLHFSLSSANKSAKIKDFSKVRRQVVKCAKVIKSNSNNFVPCRRYCEHYKINANSPVIEGYNVFFNQVINSLQRFLKDNGPQIIRNDDDESDNDQMRVLDEKNSKPKNASVADAAPSNDSVESFNFSPDTLQGVGDAYDEKAVDPYYDEYVLNKMFTFERDYIKDRRKGYVNFIKNKLHFTDVAIDYSTATANSLFNVIGKTIIDLDEFSTRVRLNGVDVGKHLYTTNIDQPLKELILHLKNKSKYRIDYEKLDPSLLNQVNEISNKNVKDFHRDNFMKFKDFSYLLKSNELMNNYDTVRKHAPKKGYKIY